MLITKQDKCVKWFQTANLVKLVNYSCDNEEQKGLPEQSSDESNVFVCSFIRLPADEKKVLVYWNKSSEENKLFVCSGCVDYCLVRI